MALDFNVIADEERNSFLINTDRFSALNYFTKLRWPLTILPENEKF